jgi:hypothetical protein
LTRRGTILTGIFIDAQTPVVSRGP